MSQRLWYLAEAIDVLHLIVVVPLLLSMLYFMHHCKQYGQWLAMACVTFVFTLQLAFLNCPLTMLSGWLRSFREPNYDPYRTSVVHKVFSHLGQFSGLHWVFAGIMMLVTGMLLLEAYRGWLKRVVGRRRETQ